MKSKTTIDFARLAAATLLIAVLSACSTTTATAPPEQSAAPIAIEEPVESWDGDGMDIPLDGSSLEAFNKSLERVKAHTNPSSYTTLVNAIEYLVVYDLSARRDRTKLAANLDGMTGREVVNMVSWQK